MRSGILRTRMAALRLNRWAPFPSEVRRRAALFFQRLPGDLGVQIGVGQEQGVRHFNGRMFGAATDARAWRR